MKTFMTAFGLIFLAELGDKTQLAAITMASETGKPWHVFLGAALAFTVLTFVAVFLGAGLALIMLAIAVIDLRSFLIPDGLNAVAGVLAILHAAAQEPATILQAAAIAVLRGTVLALIFLALRYGYARWRGRQGLGLGDVKLAFVAGAWLDWLTIPIVIQLAAFATLSAYLVRYLVSGQSLSATSRMPFGLFFAPAIWICWLLEVKWL